jgi:hypothetical protein
LSSLLQARKDKSQDNEKVEVQVVQKVVIWKKPQKEASYITGGCFLCPPSRCIINFETEAKQSRKDLLIVNAMLSMQVGYR